MFVSLGLRCATWALLNPIYNNIVLTVWILYTCGSSLLCLLIDSDSDEFWRVRGSVGDSVVDGDFSRLSSWQLAF